MNDWRELEAPARAEIEVEACGRTTTHRPSSSKTRQILRTGAQETRIRVRNTGTTPVTVRYRARGTIEEDDDWTVDHRGILGTVLAGRRDSWTVMPNADVEIAARPEVVEIPIDEYRDLATLRDKENAGNPGRCGGRPTIRGTRIAVNVILGRIGSGAAPNETTEGFPIAPRDVVTTMAYALEVIVRDEALKQGRKERT